MHTKLTGVTLALAATLVLASGITTASARILSVSESSFLARWNSLEFISLVTIRCRVTLDGSFHSRTIQKVARALIGAITRVFISHPCTGGEGWADDGTPNPGGTTNRLPFHLTYENFTGTLPEIRTIGLLLSRISFVLQVGSGCTGRYGRAEDNISFTANLTGRIIESITPVEGRNIAHLVTRLGGIFCPSEFPFRGSSGVVTGLVNTNAISVLLI
jgi:hypothetical protein